jgi:PAS domain S-box-containing protein
MFFLSGNAIYRMMYFRELLEQKKKEGIDISVITTKQSDDGICSLWSCSFCDDRNMNTKSNFMSVDGEESIIFESVPDDKNYTTGTDVGISVLEGPTTSFLEAMFSVFNTYRHLLMSSTNAIFVLDAKTMEVIEANSQCSKLIGLDRELLVGKNVKDIAKQLGMISPSFFDACLTKCKKEKRVDLKNFEIDIGGKAIIANVSACIQKFYGKDAIVITVTDVTHEKQVEREKTTISERYSKLFNIFPLPTVLLSKDDKILMANKAVEEEFGVNLSEKKDASIYDIIPKDKHEQMKKIRRTSCTKTQVIKLPVLTPNGIKNFIIFSSKADSDGNKIVVGKNISEIQDLKKDTKEAKKDVRESEEKYRTLFESSSDAIMTLAPPTWNFTNGNPATIKMFKAKDEAEFNSEGPWELSPKHQSDGQLSSVKAKKMIMKAMKTGPNFFEWTHKRFNGEEFPATVLLTKVKLGGKEFLQATVRDISEQKKTEETFKQIMDEELLTLEATTGGICKWNFMTNELYFSPKYYTMLGYKPNEFPATFESWKNMIHPDDFERAVAVAEEYIATKPDFYENEFRMRTKNGNYIWIRATGKIVERNADGEAVRMTGNHEDVTERKKAEDELKKEKELSQNIINTAQAIILQLDTDGKIVSFNPYMENLSGYKLAEVQGKDWFTTFLPECDYDSVRNLFQTAIDDVQTKGNVNPIVTKDGRQIDIRWHDKTLKDIDGKIIGLLAIGEDITEHKKAEEPKA